jgi:nitrile hydratase accessory protein
VSGLTDCVLRPATARPPDTVFEEPWEAQAFAMTLALHQKGIFTWTEWARALATQIAAAQAAGDADLGDTYITIGWPRSNRWCPRRA